MQLNQIEQKERKAYEFELLQARKRREADRKANPFIFLENNMDKMVVIKLWYPHVYRVLNHYFPAICSSPDDYPYGVISMINYHLGTMLPPGDYSDLKLEAVCSI